MKNVFNRSIALALTAALLIPTAGCGTANKAVAETEPVATQATEVREPDGTVQLAKVGDLTLTGGQLQILTRLQGGQQPDRALELWHLLAALHMQSLQYVEYVEENFHVDKELHAEYMDPCMAVSPAAKYVFDEDATFAPNSMHQAYLDAIPDQLARLAEDSGYADLDELVKKTLGGQSTGEDLIRVVTLLNRDYAYFTELTYGIEPTEEEIEAWFADHEQDYAREGLTRDSGYTLDIRNFLMVPDGAAVHPDGTVEATEKQWKTCEQQTLNAFFRWRSSPYHDEALGIEAHDHSMDTASAPVGGLYSNVRQGQLPEVLDSWCFDGERKVGDYTRLRSDYGWHILYIRDREEDWHRQARQDRILQTLREQVEKILEDWPMERLDREVQLSAEPGEAFPLELSELLYPDVAHERFPEVPIFIQQDYKDAPYGYYRVGNHGCGITSFAMLATYMTDELLTPGAMAARYGNYSSKAGSDYMLFYYPPAELGFYLQEYGGQQDRVLEALKNGQVCINVQTKGYFTRGGHFLVLAGIDEDGLVTLRDSNLYNYQRLEEHQVDKFDPKLLLNSALMYWIFDPKITSSPICSRCGDENFDGLRLLEGDYLCPRCREAALRRDAFLELLF